MTALSSNQIASYAYAAGFRGDALRVATAIAMAESGGNPTAYNPELAAGTRPGSGSRGLWQIYGQAHPEYNSAVVFDPMANAVAAFKVYQQAGNKFTPWSTFTNGSAKNYYNQLGALTISSGASQNSGAIQATGSAQIAQGSTPAPSGNILTQAVTSGITQAAQGLTSGINVNKIKTDWSFIIGGGLLVIIGLIALFYMGAREFGKTDLGQAAVKVGTRAIATALV